MVRKVAHIKMKKKAIITIIKKHTPKLLRVTTASKSNKSFNFKKAVSIPESAL